MIITKLEVQKKSSSRFNLYLDGEFLLGIGSLTITYFNIYKGKEITKEEFQEIISYEIFTRFYDRALTYVAGSLKSEKQVREYLRKLYGKKKKLWVSEKVEFEIEDTVKKVLNKMRKFGFVNDREYALQFISSRESSRPRSKKLISSELYAKGISKEAISSVIDSIDDDSMIYDVYIKKYKEKPFNMYEDSKVVGFLVRKGFSWDQISNLERRLKDEFTK